MALPGLSLDGPGEDDGVLQRELKAGEEWRFEITFSSTIQIKLLSGTAEIFGTELTRNQSFTFTGAKAAVYSWNGCKLEISGSPSVEYVSEETPMSSYVNLHFALEKLRHEANERRQQGPRVMIIGPENAGKTSLVKILTGYAIRQGHKPTVVNLDPKEGVLSLPGTLTATNFPTIMDVEEGFGSSPTNGPSSIPVKLPLVYYFGLDSPEKNTKLYKAMVSRLGLAVSSRLGDDEEGRSSGVIIDTPGLTNQSTGYEIIQHIVAEHSVNALVVLGSERLFSDMRRRFQSQPSISVMKLAKSGGCVDRDDSFMQQVQQSIIKKYFFGDAKSTLSPSTVTVEFDALNIYKISDSASSMNMSLMPIGHEDEGSPFFEKVEVSSEMQNSVLAVLHAGPDEAMDGMVESTVMGFLHISEVDEKKRRVKILAPVPGRLPTRALILGHYPDPSFMY